MEYKDYYKTLGVPRTATTKEIKAAFRKLARKHHPDVNKGDAKSEARFKELNEAHAVLSDPEKRRRYDALGADWASYQTQPGGAGRSRVHVDFGGADSGGFSEFFRSIFGGGAAGFGTTGFGGRSVEDLFGRGAQAGPPRGEDLEAVVELTLDEVLRGTTRALQVGEEGKRRVEVKIPPGVREGSRVRVPGEGGGGAGRTPGDVYLRVHLKPHSQFERKGDDLQGSLRVPLTTAVLGGEAQVPTLTGPIGIKVPPGSPPGRTFRLRGHGLPHLESPKERGDLLVALAVDLPTALTDREREIFEELRRLGR